MTRHALHHSSSRSRSYEFAFGKGITSRGTITGTSDFDPDIPIMIQYFPACDTYHVFGKGYMGHGQTIPHACESLLDNIKKYEQIARSLGVKRKSG